MKISEKLMKKLEKQKIELQKKIDEINDVQRTLAQNISPQKTDDKKPLVKKGGKKNSIENDDMRF